MPQNLIESTTPEHQLLQAKKMLQDLLLQKERFLSENKLKFFVPFGWQRKFFENAETFARCGSGGNRGGKSTTGVAEDGSWLLGERLWYPPDDPLRRAGIPAHGVKGLLIAHDWDKVTEVFTNHEGADGSDTRLGKFFEWLPRSAIVDTHKNSQGHIDQIHVEVELDGRKRYSVMHFDTVKSWKSSKQSAESSDWDFVHFDEPVPHGLFTAVTRGLLDRNGKWWVLATMLGEPWMYLLFEEQMKAGNPDYWMTEFLTDDNPHITEVARERYFQQLSQEEAEARRSGKPMAFSMRLYSNFDEKKHVLEAPLPEWKWPASNKPAWGWNVAYHIDPHPKKPHAVLFVAWDLNNIVFFDELLIKAPFSDYAEADGKAKAGVASLIRRKLYNSFVRYELCDPIAFIEDPETRRSWADALWENGLRVQKASKAKETGIVGMNDLLASRKRRVWAIGPNVPRWLQEIRIYSADENGKPTKEFDDMMEGMYRLYLHDNFAYLPRTDSEPTRVRYDAARHVDAEAIDLDSVNEASMQENFLSLPN